VLKISASVVFYPNVFPIFVVHNAAFMPVRDIVLAKPNYSFEKRQRDLEKKRKQEEKRLKKLADKAAGLPESAPDEADDDAPADADATSTST
jgi:hypothetical protein